MRERLLTCRPTPSLLKSQVTGLGYLHNVESPTSRAFTIASTPKLPLRVNVSTANGRIVSDTRDTSGLSL